jgi:hypothetical protein
MKGVRSKIVVLEKMFPAAVTVILMALSLGCHQTATAQEKTTTMSRTAESYIYAFKRGEKFTEPSEGLVSGGKITFQAVEVLGKALAVEGNDVRKQFHALCGIVQVSNCRHHVYALWDNSRFAANRGRMRVCAEAKHRKNTGAGACHE